MIDGRQGAALRQMTRLFAVGTASSSTEGQLLDRFVNRGDESAFEALVARHGPMVLGICRRMLHNPGDVEDAFQATFLVLVRKAGSIRDRELLGNWLYGVAHRISLRSRSRLAKRPHEMGIDRLDSEFEEFEPDAFEIRSVIDEEISKLPEKYRRPIVLCYLEGHTQDEAAARLQWPIGTVRGRLARARELLRTRLMRRGFAPASAILTAALTRDAKACIPHPLVERTVEAAMSSLVGRGTVAGTVSATAVTLANGVSRTLTMTKLTMIAAGVFTTGALAGGGVAVAWQAPVAPAPTAAPAAAPRQYTASPVQVAPGGTITELPVAAPQPAPAAGAGLRSVAPLFGLNTRYTALTRGPAADDLLREVHGKVDRAIEQLDEEVKALTARLEQAKADLESYRALKSTLKAPTGGPNFGFLIQAAPVPAPRGTSPQPVVPAPPPGVGAPTPTERAPGQPTAAPPSAVPSNVPADAGPASSSAAEVAPAGPGTDGDSRKADGVRS